MKTLAADTAPHVEAAQIELTRQMPAWRKLALVGQMNRALDTLALSGLKQRDPHASTAELHRRLIEQRLSPDFAARGASALPPALQGATFMPNEPNEPIAVALLVTQALEALGIPYFLGGSLAGAVHGEYRATRDVDIVAEMQMRHAAPLAQALEPAFFVQIDDIRDAIRGVVQHRADPRYRASFNIFHRATAFKVDLFVSMGRPFDQARFERRAAYVVAVEPERRAYVASAEDTILAKLDWYRLGGEVSDQQWRDVQAVLKTQAPTLDRAYLRRWAASLGVADLLDRALADAGV